MVPTLIIVGGVAFSRQLAHVGIIVGLAGGMCGLFAFHQAGVRVYCYPLSGTKQRADLTSLKAILLVLLQSVSRELGRIEAGGVPDQETARIAGVVSYVTKRLTKSSLPLSERVTISEYLTEACCAYGLLHEVLAERYDQDDWAEQIRSQNRLAANHANTPVLLADLMSTTRIFPLVIRLDGDYALDDEGLSAGTLLEIDGFYDQWDVEAFIPAKHCPATLRLDRWVTKVA